MIETGEGDYKEEILELNKLAQILRKQRLAAGAIAVSYTHLDVYKRQVWSRRYYDWPSQLWTPVDIQGSKTLYRNR